MNTYEMNLLISTDLEVLSHYFGQFSTFLLQLKSENLLKKQNKTKIKYDHFILTLYDVQNNMPSQNTRKQQQET